jgi:hypothetical protein
MSTARGGPPFPDDTLMSFPWHGRRGLALALPISLLPTAGRAKSRIGAEGNREPFAAALTLQLACQRARGAATPMPMRNPARDRAEQRIRARPPFERLRTPQAATDTANAYVTAMQRIGHHRDAPISADSVPCAEPILAAQPLQIVRVVDQDLVDQPSFVFSERDDFGFLVGHGITDRFVGIDEFS